jgi:soluble lytic murein transglycosylase-like protein
MNKFLSTAIIRARAHRVDPAIIMAIAEIESAFDPYAVRYEKDNPWVYFPRKYAKDNRITSVTEEQLQHFSFGLMQIMGSTLRSPLNFQDNLLRALNPAVNLDLGAKYIKWLMRKYTDKNDIASAYNAGRPMKRKGENTYHNQEYVDKFNASYKKWEEEICPSIRGR